MFRHIYLTRNYSLLVLFLFFLSFFFSDLYAQKKNTGRIAGALVDAQSGEALIGANVYLENTTIGAASDLNGNYIINQVPAGSYTLIVTSIGYADTKITEVQVSVDQLVKIDVTMQPEILTSETIVVEAKTLLIHTKDILISKITIFLIMILPYNKF